MSVLFSNELRNRGTISKYTVLRAIYHFQKTCSVNVRKRTKSVTSYDQCIDILDSFIEDPNKFTMKAPYT